MSLDAEVWDHTFGERAPDFVLTIRGETIGRVYHCTVRNGGPRWVWSIVCSVRWVGVGKPEIPLGGEAENKPEAIKELRAAWAIEREWRERLREVTAKTHGCWSPNLLAAVWRGYEVDTGREKGAPAEAEAPGAIAEEEG